MKNITLATAHKTKFFRGDNERPTTEWENYTIAMLAGATIFLGLIRAYQWIKYLFQ